MELLDKAEVIKAMEDLEQEDIEAYGCLIPEGFDGERAKDAIGKLAIIDAVPIQSLEEMRKEIKSYCIMQQAENLPLREYAISAIIYKYIKQYKTESDVNKSE